MTAQKVRAAALVHSAAAIEVAETAREPIVDAEEPAESDRRCRGEQKLVEKGGAAAVAGCEGAAECAVSTTSPRQPGCKCRRQLARCPTRRLRWVEAPAAQVADSPCCHRPRCCAVVAVRSLAAAVRDHTALVASAAEGALKRRRERRRASWQGTAARLIDGGVAGAHWQGWPVQCAAEQDCAVDGAEVEAEVARLDACPRTAQSNARELQHSHWLCDGQSAVGFI